MTLAKIREYLIAAEAIVESMEAAQNVAMPPAASPPAANSGPRGLRDPAAFFTAVRGAAPLGPALSEQEVRGCQRILKACEGQPIAWAAYILATEVHETAGQMVPLREYGKGAGRPYGQPGKHGGQVPYGRGDAQLTWDQNYERADRELGLNGALIANYDLALDPDISARIIVAGMTGGWFTGKSLNDFLPGVASRAQFANARRVVNGTDKADLIAGYAVTFQAALQAGGWQ